MGRSARSLRWWAVALPAVVLAVLVPAAPFTSSGPGLGPSSAPLAQPPAPSVHVVAAGDFGSSADAAAVLSRTAELAPDAAFAVGDLSYNVAPESDWCSFAAQRLGPDLAFELLSGNHESDGYNGSIEDFAACLPNRLPGLVGTYGREYYVDLPVDKPVMRVINTSAGLHFPEGTWDYSAGDVHYTWTAAAIDSARAKGISWVMVNNHYPCLGMAAYACVMPHDFYDLLQDRRVDLVVDGHDHAYMRSHQLAGGSVGCPRIPTSGFDADCVADSDNAYAAGRGTVFATVGTGGRALRPVNLADPDRPNFAAWSGSNANPTYGVLDLVATQSVLTARFVRASGGTFDDSFTITRDPPPAPPPPSEPLVFVAMPAARVLDTRPNRGGAGPLGAAEQRRISVASAQADGSPVVPAGALAVAVNLTAPRPSASGHFRLMPGTAAALTSASAINFRSGESIANGLTTRLAPDGTLKLYNGAAVPVDAVVDVVGYFVPAAGGTPAQLAGGLFTPVTPTRVYDSVQSGAATAGGAWTAVELASVLPPGASAVAYNITVVEPAAAGHLRVHRAGSPLPESSTINFAAGDRVANATSVQVGDDRRLAVYNSGRAPVR
ncbi:MAG: hypothetical protein RLZ55_1732, partial [Actinomycetota bacterium]